MFLSLYNDYALFLTRYDHQYDLAQLFRGLSCAPTTYNGPVDFMATGLVKRGKPDCWHIDVPFSLTTDEAPPFHVKDDCIGSNHGFHKAVRILAPAHAICINEVGTLWTDDAGTVFTLLRVETPDHLLFLSENVGKSKTDYQFVTNIQGVLTQEKSGRRLSFERQSLTDMLRTVRPVKKEAYAWILGKRRRIYDSTECEMAELIEEYEIINPATVAPALSANRPQGGYLQNPDLSNFGEAMIAFSVKYRVLASGETLCIFDHKKLQDVKIDRYMGAMFQERIDAYGGGLRRYLPKIKPVDTPEGVFDFSTPYPLDSEAFPKNKFVTPEYFETPLFPPDRIVDYFYDGEGNAKMGFACGYLPLFDGRPEYRRQNLTIGAHLIRTRKAYPTFLNGNLGDVKGIAYKKYFPVTSNAASWYTVQAEEKTYLYADFFAPATLTIPVSGKVSLFEKAESVSYRAENGTLTVTAQKGYAVFLIE
ncbi:MAG: hypothetical protein IJX81_07210 [Clostridia bacterium]|nr:hypothetical protein [Clostridia bacterium]